MACNERIYTVGDNVKCSGEIRRFSDNALYDPGAVFFKYRDPSGNETVWQFGADEEVGQTGVGMYYAGVPVDEPGTWYYSFYSTGSGQAAAEQSFVVAASNFS